MTQWNNNIASNSQCHQKWLKTHQFKLISGQILANRNKRSTYRNPSWTSCGDRRHWDLWCEIGTACGKRKGLVIVQFFTFEGRNALCRRDKSNEKYIFLSSFSKIADFRDPSEAIFLLLSPSPCLLLLENKTLDFCSRNIQEKAPQVTGRI